MLSTSYSQTVQQREKKLKLQEKRKALMEARLAKVRQRKQLKQPVVAEAEKDEGVKEEGEKKEGEKEEGEKKEGEEDRGTEVEEKVAGGEVDPVAAMIDVELGRAREKAEKGETEEGSVSKKKAPYVRPWDKGKGIYYNHAGRPSVMEHLLYITYTIFVVLCFQLWTQFERERKSLKMSVSRSLPRLPVTTRPVMPLHCQNERE